MAESTETTTPPTGTPHKPAHHHSHKREVALIALGIIFITIGFLWLMYWLIWGRFAVYTDDAYVNGNMVELMPQVAGTVIEINTDNTHLVTQGQVIIKLDPSDMAIALARAEARLAETVRRVRQNFENVASSQATLILNNADLLKAQKDYKRRVGLVGINAVSREEFQHIQTAMQAAQAKYDYALHQLRSTQALVQNSHLYTHPLVETAKANYKNAYLNLQRTVIVAPVTGYIAKRNVQVGQQVMMNSPMLAIVPLNQIWVDANYKESQLEYLRIGQPVSLRADAYSSVEYHGKIYGLNAGTGAAFSLLPPQNATGNWIKIVQRLPVRVALDPEEIKKHPLQLGLSMRVTTNIHDVSGHMLARQPLNKAMYSTDVYAKQLAQANEHIAKILQENSPNMYMPRIELNV